MEVALALVLGGVVGWVAHRWRNIDYRRRWREAMQLIDHTDELAPGTPAKGKPPRRVEKLPAWSRVSIEKERLEAGKPPRDSLHRLPAWAVTDIERTRLKHGWEQSESGDWAKDE